MLFYYKTLQRKHGPPVQLLQPTAIPNSVCGLEMHTGDDYWIFGNGKGHAFLADAFACAAGLRQGQFIYIPVSMIPNKELCEKWVHFFGPVNGKTKVDSFIGGSSGFSVGNPCQELAG